MEVSNQSDLFKVRRRQRDGEDSKETDQKYRPDKNESNSTSSASSNAQKLRFSIAHIMGFMGQSDVKVKEEADVGKVEEVDEGDAEKSPNIQMPKLWRPTPSREYIAAAAVDFGAMAILSRQYSLLGATLSSPWKNNFLSSYGQLFNSAMTSHVTQDQFPVPPIGATHQNASPYARCVMQQQQQQHLRHHSKSLFG
jgi:hypothetical protein